MGQPQPVVSGNDVGRPFTILGSVAVTMTNMTVTRGRTPLEPDGSARGGGIFNQGHLTLNHVTISYNQANADDGVAAGESGHESLGGGLYSDCTDYDCGSLVLRHTAVLSNTAQGGDGADETTGAVTGHGGRGRGGGFICAVMETMALAAVVYSM